MENLKIRKIVVQVLLVVAVFFAVSSCSKDDEPTADYIGSWGTYTTIEDGMESKVTITFTSNSFNNLYQIKNETTSSWMDYYNMKGSISVNKQLLTGTITEIGIAVDIITGMPSATMTYYKAGSAYFDMFLEDADATFKSEYSVSGNTLTLKTDDNNDGDYLDEDEIITFTKQ